MKRILSAILIFFLLSSQTAVAFDTYKFTPDFDYSESSQNTSSDCDSHNGGDHCCHTVAHFVGLISSISVYQPIAENNLDLHTQFSFISQPKLPPTPPPIV